MIKAIKLFLSSILMVCLLSTINAYGEYMYRSNGLSGNILQWNDYIIAVSMTKHLFREEYCLFLLSPDDCKCVMKKSVPFNQDLHYFSSKDIILERRSGTAAPLSYATTFIRYSFCKISNINALSENAFTDLPKDKGEFIGIADGVIIKYGNDHTDDHELLKLDTDSGTWCTIDVKREEPWSNTRDFRDTCICLNSSEGVYYSPGSDAIYNFSATKGIKPHEFILYHNQLVYAADGGIYRCRENDPVPEIIMSSDEDFEIGKTTPFYIADNTLYIGRFPRDRVKRVRFDNYEILPDLNISYDSSTDFLVHNGYLYLAKHKNNDIKIIDYISVIDLESGTEVKRHFI